MRVGSIAEQGEPEGRGAAGLRRTRILIGSSFRDAKQLGIGQEAR